MKFWVTEICQSASILFGINNSQTEFTAPNESLKLTLSIKSNILNRNPYVIYNYCHQKSNDFFPINEGKFFHVISLLRRPNVWMQLLEFNFYFWIYILNMTTQGALINSQDGRILLLHVPAS